ncbi:MAG: TonB-dependent receptor [Pseudomonadota bacterium]
MVNRTGHLAGVSALALLAVTPPQYAYSQSDEELELDEIVIVGSQVDLGGEYGGGDVARSARAGILGNLDYLDAPFSSTAFTEELAREQQAISVTDLVRNDPTVQIAQGFGNFQEVYVIRGFPVFSDDFTYNGLFGVLPRQFVAAELVERLEVFRGANAFINGAAPGTSGAGGLVNIVPKRAGKEDLNRLTLGLRSGAEFIGAVDVARSFGRNDEVGVRFNAVRRDGEVAVDDQDRELTVLSLGATYEVTRARFSVDFGYQNNLLDNPRPQITPIGAPPEAPDADFNFAVPGTFADDEQFFGAFRGEFDLTDSVTAWVAFGGRSGEEVNALANPTVLTDGSFTASRFDNVRDDRVLSGDLGIRANFDTGPVGHTFITSGSFFDLDSENAFAFNFDAITGSIFPGGPETVLSPIGDFLGGDLDDPLTTLSNQNLSIAIADTMSFFDDRLLVTAGVRFQDIETEAFDFTTGETVSDVNGDAFTPAFGFVAKPLENVSIFGNYAENLQPGEVVGAVSPGGIILRNANDVLDPFRGEQFELGAKYGNDDYGVTFSLFQVTQANAIVTDVVDADDGMGGLFQEAELTDDGEQRTRGIELVAYGEPVDGLSLIGGLTFLDADLNETQDGINEGNTPIGIPDFRATLNARYDIPIIPGFSIDGRVIYSDSQFIDLTNDNQIDGFTRLDLGVSYAANVASKDVVMRLRVENVTDNEFFESSGGFPGANFLVLAQPRTVLFSVAADF